LAFDPILNGQDYPDKGYAPKRFRWPVTKLTWVMEEIRAPDFKVSVNLVSINNQWKIDGIGEINRSQQ
jgi:hypothetical protein